MSHHKLTHYLLASLPLVIYMLVLLCYPYRTEQISLEEVEKVIYGDNDTVNVDNPTRSEFKITEQGIDFSYQLGDVAIPYTGVTFHLETPLLKSDFDELHFVLSSDVSNRIPSIFEISEHELIDGRKVPLFYQRVLAVGPQPRTLHIPLDEYSIPEWCFSEVDATKDELGDGESDLISSFNIQGAPKQNIGRTADTIHIHEVSLKQNYSRFLKPWSLIVFAFPLGLLLFNLLRRGSGTPKVQLSYKQVDVTDLGDEQLKLLIDFINEHYPEPITLDTVHLETGISKNKVSELLIKGVGLSFKAYLTKIRMEEAKRLLKETEMNVSEIATLVGFGNISHFNRVFKTEEGVTPLGYRTSE